MKLYMLLIIFLFPITSFSQDTLHFNVFARTGGDMGKIYMHFIVIDPLGRRTGYFPENGVYPGPLAVANLNEMPNSSYSTECISDEETGESGTGESIQFYSQPIVVGTYTITFFTFTDTNYTLRFDLFKSYDNLVPVETEGYISSGTTFNYTVFIDPTPGAPAPTITKVVTFQTLRDDLNVAYKLNQIGDDKFVKSLLSMINISEKLSNRCGAIDNKIKDKKDGEKKIKKQCYKPVVVILRMFVKRLEIANKLCDLPKDCKSKCKKPADCDEENEWAIFSKKHIKDKDYKEFFEEWEKYECHKDKKMCKRFVTDNSLGIISDDVNWLIKSFGDDIWEYYKKEENPYIYPRSKVLFK